MKHHLINRFRYLQHYFRSGSKFTIHSPFGYKIYSEILKDKKDYPEYVTLQEDRMSFNSKVPDKYCRLLFRLTRYFKPETILMIGAQDERIASFLSAGYPGSLIRSINNPGRYDPAIDSGMFDLVFISGDLPGNVFLDYFSLIMQHIHNDSVFIIWNVSNPGTLQDKWKDVQSLPGITLTINLFRVGLLFFNQNLSREDFILRY